MCSLHFFSMSMLRRQPNFSYFLLNFQQNQIRDYSDLMGKILSTITKPIRDFNVENRAFKVISKDKPTPAPRHPTTVKYFGELPKKIEPDKKLIQEEKPKELHEWLKKVYVTSKDPEKIKETDASNEESISRALPQNRNILPEAEFGFHEPEKITKGKFTMRQAIEFLSQHKQNPELWTAEAIAKEYHLDKDLTQKVLHYFKPFEIYVPKSKTDSTIQIGSSKNKDLEENSEEKVKK